MGEQVDHLQLSISKDLPISVQVSILNGKIYFKCRKGIHVLDLCELPALAPRSEEFERFARQQYLLDIKRDDLYLKRDQCREKQGKEFLFDSGSSSSSECEDSPVSFEADPSLPAWLQLAHSEAAILEKKITQDIVDVGDERKRLEQVMSKHGKPRTKLYFCPGVSLKFVSCCYKPGYKQPFSYKCDTVLKDVFFCDGEEEHKVISVDSWNQGDVERFLIFQPPIMTFIRKWSEADLLHCSLKDRCHKVKLRKKWTELAREVKLRKKWTELAHKIV